MATFVCCGNLFTGRDDVAQGDGTVVIENGVIVFAGATARAPKRRVGDEQVDYSRFFVMPGLIDVHTHLAYGEAKSKEDIDLYKSMEFRAIRAMFFAQRVLAAGYTSICAPGDSGMISTAVRDAVRAGLFDGPRVTAAGPYLTNAQGFQNSYPTWVGVPVSAIARVVRNRDEAIEEIRRQAKDGVDCIKIDLDGTQHRPNGEIVAAFTEDELRIMVDEIHRQGKRAIAHARGREAVLYAGRTGVDLIFHASWIDDAGIDAVLRTGGVIAPSFTFPRNTIDFTLPSEPAFKKGRIEAELREFEIACVNLRKAKAAGIPFATGTDTGFAVTPYGEWHAREIDLFVRYLGFSPAEALRAATEVSARCVDRDKVGVLERGRVADFIALDGSPLDDVSILLDRTRLRAVHLAGKEIRIPDRDYNSRMTSEGAWVSWTELYTREKVAALQRGVRPAAAQ